MEEVLIPFLRKNGFIEEKVVHDTENFGNQSKLLASSDLLVKIINERSKKFILLASPEDTSHWIELYLIRALIVKESNLTRPLNYNELELFFIENFNRIEELFSSENIVSTDFEILNLKKERSSQRFGKKT